MLKWGVVAIVLAGLFITSFVPYPAHVTPEKKPSKRERIIQKNVFDQVAEFRDYVKDSLCGYASQPNIDTQIVRQAFLHARLLFKRFEWAASYFASDLTKG